MGTKTEIDKEKVLRISLEEGGLAYPHSVMLLGKPVFEFELEAGNLYALQDTATVAEMVRIARSVAADERYGEHNSLLLLVARRHDLVSGANSVTWYDTKSVTNPKGLDIWITLREWLKDEGYPYLKT